MKTEAELKTDAEFLRAELREIAKELESPRLGWVSTPPPPSGVIEVLHGFRTRVYNRVFMESIDHSVFPGLVDAAAYEIPNGTVWRPDPRAAHVIVNQKEGS